MFAFQRTLGALSLTLVLGMGGCAPSAMDVATNGISGKSTPNLAGGIGPISNSVDTDRYFPLKRTFTWTYAVTLASPTSTSSAVDTTAITTLLDSNGTRTAAYLSERKINGTLTSQESGTFSQTVSLLTMAGNGGSETIQLPLRAGNTWTSGTLTARSFAVESLPVAGKTYKDLIGISYEKNGDTKAVRYFASGYGIVKQITRSTVNGELVTVTSELSAAKLSAVTGITLSPPSVTLAMGGNPATVSARVNYDDGSQDSDLLLTIASQSVATINGNLVTPVGQGTTVITVRSNQDSTVAATLSVTVN